MEPWARVFTVLSVGTEEVGKEEWMGQYDFDGLGVWAISDCLVPFLG